MKRRDQSRRAVALALLVAIALAGAGVAAVVRRNAAKPGAAVAGAEAAADEPSPREEPPATVPAGPPGRVKLTLGLPPGSALDAIGYVVQSAANTVAARGTIPISDPKALSVSHEVVLPSGAGNRVTFLGSVSANGAQRTMLLGNQTFDVAPGRTSEVKLAAGVGSGAGDGAHLNLGTAKAGTSDQESCQACELASGVPLCDAANLTATSNQDPRTGEQTGVGWGCGTLRTEASRAACVALLHCLSVNDCEKGGRNPVMGCYCGGAAAGACLAGQGLSGVCIPQYQAAAAASPGGPPATASVAELSKFIAISAADPTTPIGLADNLRKCAIDTPCDVCSAL